MKRLLLALLMLCLLPAAAAEEGKTLLRCGDGQGKWGYVDTEGNWVIPARYDGADEFRGNYAAVIVLPEDYAGEDIWTLDAMGVIDREGNWVLPPEYFLDEGYDGGYYGGKDTGIWIVRKHGDMQWGVDGDGEEILLSDAKEGFFDIPSGCFSGLKWKGVWPWCSDSTLIPVMDENGAGYADRSTGELAIPCRYFCYDPSNFYEGVASVAYGNEAGDPGDFFLIDETGAEIPLPEGIHSVYGQGAKNGRIVITDGALYGLCDLEGHIIAAPQYASILERTKDGLMWVTFPEGDDGFVDRDGRVIERNVDILRWWEMSLNTGYYSRETGENERTLYTLAGEKVFTLRAENLVRLHFPMENGLCWFETDPSGKIGWWQERYFGLVNMQGTVISAAQWRLADFEDRSFPEGLQLVGRLTDEGMRWGYIDETGQVVIPLRYDRAESFSGERALVRTGGRMAWIDREGNEIVSWEIPD